MNMATTQLLTVPDGLRLLFCTTCYNVVDANKTAIQNHLNKHEIASEDVAAAVDYASRQLGRLDEGTTSRGWNRIIEQLPREPVRRIPFLRVQDIIRCDDCGKCTLDNKQMSKHVNESHGGSAISAKTRGHALRMGSTTRYVAVTGDGNKATINMSMEALYQITKDEKPETEPITCPTTMDANSFIEVLGFGRYLAGRDPQDIVNSIQHNEIDTRVGLILSQLKLMLAGIRGDMAEEGDIVLSQLRKRSHDVDMRKVGPFRYDIQNKTLINNYAPTFGKILKHMWSMHKWTGAGDPPCQLTPEQHRAIDKAVNCEWDDDELDTEELIYDVIRSILSHDLRSTGFESVVVSSMAAMAIDTYTRGWKTARMFGNHFSAFIKIALMMVYGMTVREMRRSAVDEEDRLSVLRENMHKYVYYPADNQTGGQLPLTICFDMEDKVIKVRSGESPQANIEWSGDSRTVLCGFGIQAKCRDIGEMMEANLTHLEEDMEKLLFGKSVYSKEVVEVIPEDLGTILDDKRNETVGFSFLQHKQNQAMASAAERFLLRSIDRDAELKKRWLPGRLLNGGESKRYMGLAETARKRLALGVYWGSGQPVRGTEIMSLRWKNTSAGGARNILIHDGAVATRTAYNKSRWREKTRTSHIWRRLTARCSRLIVIWIAVILPFLEFLEDINCEGGDGKEKELSNGYLFSKTTTGKEEVIGTNPITEELKKVTAVQFGKGINLQEMRHILIGFAHRFVDTKAAADELAIRPDLQDDSGDKEVCDMVDEQAGHSAYAGRVYYAIEFDQGAKFDRAMFLSTATINLFRVSGTKRKGVGDDDGDNTVAEALQQGRRQELGRVLRNPAELESVLACGSRIRLRDHQRRVLMALAGNTAGDIVHVAPTGSGKSMSFMLPALLSSGGRFILIEPTRALQDDMSRRLEEANINAYNWRPTLTDRSDKLEVTKVVVVTPESFEGRAFQNTVNHWNARQEIDLVILDEAHEVLNSEFRDTYNRIGEVMHGTASVRLYLTGTLPLSREGAFKAKLGLDERATFIRERCSNPGHGYSFFDDPAGDRFIPLARNKLERLRKGDSAIFFFKGIDECWDAAQQLQLPSYHRHVVDKETVIAQWREEKGAICATSALLTGLDIPNITLIIFKGAFSLMDIIQGFGRARGVASVMLIANKKALGSKELSGFAVAECRRQYIQEQMDGDGAPCSTGDNPCDNCSRHMASAATESHPGQQTTPQQWGSSEASSRLTGTTAFTQTGLSDLRQYSSVYGQAQTPSPGPKGSLTAKNYMAQHAGSLRSGTGIVATTVITNRHT
ncbi:hypothetical protein VM1G_11234 [Cytospora mali]|uniref:Uncharacterized protein n=1 Tax=Cytospora mali TaxID=578113 RepID=A0A194VKB2_CYTMA|nr:hypothetical protein VM1G_11234 [Valsa mali]